MIPEFFITYLTIFLFCAMTLSCTKNTSKRYSAGGGSDDLGGSTTKKVRPKPNDKRSAKKKSAKPKKAVEPSSKRSKTRPSTSKKQNSAPVHPSSRPESWGNKVGLKEHVAKPNKYTPPHGLSLSPEVLSFDSNGSGKILLMNCEDHFYYTILLACYGESNSKTQYIPAIISPSANKEIIIKQQPGTEGEIRVYYQKVAEKPKDDTASWADENGEYEKKLTKAKFFEIKVQKLAEEKQVLGGIIAAGGTAAGGGAIAGACAIAGECAIAGGRLIAAGHPLSVGHPTAAARSVADGHPIAAGHPIAGAGAIGDGHPVAGGRLIAAERVGGKLRPNAESTPQIFDDTRLKHDPCTYEMMKDDFDEIFISDWNALKMNVYKIKKSAIVTSTSTPGSIEMLVIFLSTSLGQKKERI
uniref:Uncharacterized protein n=1 Tax=Panagrolaimus sp. PS1159 TaxID=55785 RepID=A0AC35GS65_9BILA